MGSIPCPFTQEGRTFSVAEGFLIMDIPPFSIITKYFIITIYFFSKSKPVFLKKTIKNTHINFYEDRLMRSWSKIGGTEWLMNTEIFPIPNKFSKKKNNFQNRLKTLIKKSIKNTHMNFHEDRLMRSWSKIGGTEWLMTTEIFLSPNKFS